jgi:hypothetical protein
MKYKDVNAACFDWTAHDAAHSTAHNSNGDTGDTERIQVTRITEVCRMDRDTVDTDRARGRGIQCLVLTHGLGDSKFIRHLQNACQWIRARGRKTVSLCQRRWKGRRCMAALATAFYQILKDSSDQSTCCVVNESALEWLNDLPAGIINVSQ